uniref:Uncharacterized protein n=2 Tax=Micrurus lemniscatus lemniscatus TaxID=129467 RepID=A0A2D4HI41_MICLE
MFFDLLDRQWASATAPQTPTNLDKRFYNVASEYANSLKTPQVDESVVALASPSHVVTEAEEALKPEDKSNWYHTGGQKTIHMSDIQCHMENILRLVHQSRGKPKFSFIGSIIKFPPGWVGSM